MTPTAPNPAIDRTNLDAELRCLQRAVARARLQHKRAGRPIVIWRDGHVVLLPPDQIPDDSGL